MGWTEGHIVYAAVGGAISRNASHAGISGSHDDGGTLQAELQEFVALPFLIIRREVLFLLAIGDRYDISRLVNTTPELALVATWVGIGIDRIEGRRVASLAVARSCQYNS